MAKFFTVAHRHQAEKQFGAGQSTVVAKRAAAAARRQLLMLPLEQHHAFAHITLHFEEDLRKPVHGVFLDEYHSPAALTKLLLRAIDRPGTEPMLSKSDDGDWAVVIQTWIGSPIGYQPQGQQHLDLAYLRLIVDLNGDLITANPAASYQLPGNQVQV